MSRARYRSAIVHLMGIDHTHLVFRYAGGGARVTQVLSGSRPRTDLLDRGANVASRIRPNLDQLSPLGWEHINLTGDYVWKPGTGTRRRPLRQLRLSIGADEPSP